MNNDDRFGKLDALGDWELVNDEQDIRGCTVTSVAGERFGTVDDMLVDKEREHVAAVRLDDGRIIPADHLEIRGRDVIYHDDGAASRIDYATVRRPVT